MVNAIETRVGKVAYSDGGEGPAVVLLHAALHDRRDFDPIASRLRRDHRVIALDWPGHGESPAPAPNYRPTAASFADVLTDVVAGLDLPSAAFIGNSVGGFAAARLAITDPQRVSRLVLVNSGGFIAGPVTNLYCRILGTPAVMKRVLPRSIRSYMKATSDSDYAVQERALARARTRDGVVLTAALWRSFAEPDYDLRPHADRITAPCLVIYTRGAAGGAANGPRAVLLGPGRIPGHRRAVPGRRTVDLEHFCPRYSQVTGGPCGEHTASSRSSPPGQQRVRTANSTGDSGVRRCGSSVRWANGASGRARAPSASISATTDSCSVVERYCHMMECHSTVSVPAATSRPATASMALRRCSGAGTRRAMLIAPRNRSRRGCWSGQT